MLRPLLLLLVICLSQLCAGEASEAQLLDRTVRYVNDQTLTMGDVRTRLWERAQDMQRAGKSPPMGAAMLSFAEECLEQLTDEELVVQFGKEFAEKRKYRLVDQEQIRRRVQDVVARNGGNIPLPQQAEMAKRFEREQMVRTVLEGFFYPKAALVTEAEIQAAYQQRKAQNSIPARIQALQIVFRPTDAAEREQVQRAKMTVFQDAQEARIDAQLRQAVESRLDAYLAAKPAEQARILDEAVQAIASGAAARQDLDRKSLELVTAAQRLLQQVAAFRDADQTKAQLEALRKELAGKGADDFRAAAKRLSQGPNAVQGGDLAPETGGWVEPGRFSAAFDEKAFACKAGELSEVFVIDQTANLVLVTAREDARVRSLDEVRGDLRVFLEREREAEIRANALAMMRSKASIRDVVPLAKLLE